MSDPHTGPVCEPGRRGRRVRDFQRTYKACELCRRKKVRCIVDTPSTSCLRCQRELKTCVFSDERSYLRRGHNTRREGSSSKENGSYDCMTLDNPTVRSLTARVDRPEAQVQAGHPPGHDWNTVRIENFDDSTGTLNTSNESGSSSQFGTNDITSPPLQSDNFMRTLVSNNKDAMKLLFEAATEQAENDDTLSSSSSESRNHADPSRRQATPGGESSTPTPNPLRPEPVSQDVLELWRAFRFTKMGWFAAEEAIAYVDLFHKNLAPLSPVSRHFNPRHEDHFRLITQEPLLCCVILMISSHYHVLEGAGGLARSTLIHHRLWEHCQHLILRLLLGQEKRSKAKTRTKGSIEALLLIIEWHPRGINLPPVSDGWDSSLLLSEADPRDDPSGNHADTNDENYQWLRDVITPAKTSDRMSWMLLGCVQSLALELGVCDSDKRPKADAESSRENRLCRLIYVFMEQHSNRLGCPSMISTSLLQLLSGPTKDMGEDSHAIAACVELTKLTRTIFDVLYPSTGDASVTLGGGRYINIIKHFQQQLLAWKSAHLDPTKLSFQTYEELSIEFNHLRAFMNSFGIQVAVDRILSKGLSIHNNTDVLPSSITATDYAFIKEVMDGSCEVLESVSRLFYAGVLRFCPVRIFLRVITASLFLLKALGLGARTADLHHSLRTLEKAIKALRESNLDEMHLAFRYGELLQMHAKKFRAGMISASVPRGIPPILMNTHRELYNGMQSQDDGLVEVPISDVDNWMALPFDPSVAPFGGWSAISDVPEPDERTREFLWNLPHL